MLYLTTPVIHPLKFQRLSFLFVIPFLFLGTASRAQEATPSVTVNAEAVGLDLEQVKELQGMTEGDSTLKFLIEQLKWRLKNPDTSDALPQIYIITEAIHEKLQTTLPEGSTKDKIAELGHELTKPVAGGGVPGLAPGGEGISLGPDGKKVDMGAGERHGSLGDLRGGDGSETGGGGGLNLPKGKSVGDLNGFGKPGGGGRGWIDGFFNPAGSSLVSKGKYGGIGKEGTSSLRVKEGIYSGARGEGTSTSAAGTRHGGDGKNSGDWEEQSRPVVGPPLPKNEVKGGGVYPDPEKEPRPTGGSTVDVNKVKVGGVPVVHIDTDAYGNPKPPVAGPGGNPRIDGTTSTQNPEGDGKVAIPPNAVPRPEEIPTRALVNPPTPK